MTASGNRRAVDWNIGIKASNWIQSKRKSLPLIIEELFIDNLEPHEKPNHLPCFVSIETPKRPDLFAF